MKKPSPARQRSTIRKHSLLVAGHATSVSLEEAFWSGLRAIAIGRQTTTANLVAELDARRDAANLSSAIRVYVLDFYRSGPADPFSGADLPVEDSDTGSRREP